MTHRVYWDNWRDYLFAYGSHISYYIT
jgi:hypothetical protein